MAVTVQGALDARVAQRRGTVSAIATPTHTMVSLCAPWPAPHGNGRGDQPLVACGIRSESAQSPHYSAQQRTTVRNKVEEKALRPAVMLQTCWWGRWRHLLCKQGVVGSSPIDSTIVSTTKVLVRGLIRPPAGRSRSGG